MHFVYCSLTATAFFWTKRHASLSIYLCVHKHITPPIARKLTLEDSHTVKRYNDRLHKFCIRHKLYKRIEEFHATVVFPLPPHRQREYERIDKLMVQGMEDAEKHCRKLFVGAVKWSPAFSEATEKVEMWYMLSDYMHDKTVNWRRLQLLRKRYDTQMPISKAVAKYYLNIAHANRRKVKKNAEILSLEYREQLANAIAEQGNKPRAAVIKQLNAKEEARLTSRKIKFLTGKLQGGGTTFVTRTRRDGTVEEITDKVALETAIIKENIVKYHQTEDSCPLFTPQLMRDIGPMGEGPKVQDILQGTYECAPDTPKHVKTFIQSMSQPVTTTQPEGCFLMSQQEFRESWKVVKERTSSSGAHIGHYKAACQHDELSRLLHLRSEIPFLSGYAPQRYRNGVDVMLLKKAGVTDITKLRTIVLFDSESNHNNKRIGRQAMHAALAQNLIAEEQYSRPGRSAIEHALNRRLVFDHQRYDRSPLALACSDLKSCYDRVVHAAASLALQRIGVPIASIVSMFDSIRRMTHCVRTAFGESEGTYGGDTVPEEYITFIQGLLQGNGAGPQIWSILSSTIFDALRGKGYGLHFVTAITKELFHLVGFSYVDDCDLATNNSTVQLTHSMMQAALTEWEELIKVTGGCLVPDKSSWYLVDYIWKRGKWICIDAKTDEMDLVATTKDGQQVSLKYMLSHQAMSMLGVYLAPDGNNKDQIKHLRKTTSRWASCIRTGHASAREAWVAINTTITKTVQYCLPATTLTQKDCDFIMAPIFGKAFPKAGLPGNLPKAVRYGTIDSGGVGIQDPFLLQGSHRVSYLVHHLWKQTPTGNLLRLSLEKLQVEAGYTSDFFARPYPLVLKHLVTQSWIRDCLVFMYDHDIQLPGILTPLLPRCEGDKGLMELFSKHTSDTSTLRALNRCRMQKSIFFFSDIVNASGKALSKEAMTKERIRNNKYAFRSKHHTSATDWTIWRKFLITLCANDNYTLGQPLGPWTVHLSDYHLQWQFFFDPSTNTLYDSNSDNNIRVYSLLNTARGRTRSKTFPLNTNSAVTVLPPGVVRVSVTRDSSAIYLSPHWRRHEPSPPSSALFDSISPIKELLSDGYHTSSHWLCAHLQRSSQLDLLFSDFTMGRSRAGSDGSYYKRYGLSSCSWRIESNCGTQFIEGGGLMPGPSDTQCAYRGEVGGLMGSIAVITALEQHLNCTTNVITGSDCMSALKRFTSDPEYINSNWCHCDLLSIASDMRKRLRSTPMLTYVEAHKDDNSSDLTMMEQLNVLMDILAKSFVQNQVSSPKPLLSFVPATTQGITPVIYKGDGIASSIASTLASKISHNRMLSYLARKRFTSTNLLSHFSHTAYGNARRESSTWMQHFTTKWLCKCLPTEKILFRRNHSTSPLCSLCSYAEENLTHVLQCPDPTSTNTWTTSISDLSQWLNRQDTDPILHDIIIDSLTARDLTTTELLTTIPHSRSHAMALATQTMFGWENMLLGFIATEFTTTQQTYYEYIGSKRTGSRWTTNLIKQFWRILQAMWLSRNRIKHDTEAEGTTANTILLRGAITREYTRGYDTLPRTLYSSYFTITLDTLLTTATIYQKQWYTLIKLAREQSHSDILDEFSASSSLRAWVGLPLRNTGRL